MAKEDGSNWAVFATPFQGAMLVTKLWAHVDGTATQPTPRDTAKHTSMERAALKEWAYEDTTVRRLVNTRLPDSILGLCVFNCKMAKAR